MSELAPFHVLEETDRIGILLVRPDPQRVIKLRRVLRLGPLRLRRVLPGQRRDPLVIPLRHPLPPVRWFHPPDLFGRIRSRGPPVTAPGAAPPTVPPPLGSRPRGQRTGAGT